jgi:hypothetical protein
LPRSDLDLPLSSSSSSPLPSILVLIIADSTRTPRHHLHHRLVMCAISSSLILAAIVDHRPFPHRSTSSSSSPSSSPRHTRVLQPQLHAHAPRLSGQPVARARLAARPSSSPAEARPPRHHLHHRVVTRALFIPGSTRTGVACLSGQPAAARASPLVPRPRRPERVVLIIISSTASSSCHPRPRPRRNRATVILDARHPENDRSRAATRSVHVKKLVCVHMCVYACV